MLLSFTVEATYRELVFPDQTLHLVPNHDVKTIWISSCDYMSVLSYAHALMMCVLWMSLAQEWISHGEVGWWGNMGSWIEHHGNVLISFTCIDLIYATLMCRGCPCARRTMCLLLWYLMELEAKGWCNLAWLVNSLLRWDSVVSNRVGISSEICWFSFYILCSYWNLHDMHRCVNTKAKKPLGLAVQMSIVRSSEFTI